MMDIVIEALGIRKSFFDSAKRLTAYRERNYLVDFGPKVSYQPGDNYSLIAHLFGDEHAKQLFIKILNETIWWNYVNGSYVVISCAIPIDQFVSRFFKSRLEIDAVSCNELVSTFLEVLKNDEVEKSLRCGDKWGYHYWVDPVGEESDYYLTGPDFQKISNLQIRMIMGAFSSMASGVFYEWWNPAKNHYTMVILENNHLIVGRPR